MRTLALLVVLGAGCTKTAPMKASPPLDRQREAKPDTTTVTPTGTGTIGAKDAPRSPDPDGDAAGEPGDPEPAKLSDASGPGASRGLRKHSAAPTTVGQPVSQGNLDKAIIRRYIKRVLGKISECYEKELTTQPALEGKVMVQFEIAPDGKVSKATGSGMAKVDACVAAVIQTIEFPKPLGGGSVAVTYPFMFRPAGG